MSSAVEKVAEEALGLPVEARVDLVDRLLASLNLPTDPAMDRLWAEEAERRVREIEEGKVDLIPGEVVFEKLRRKLVR